MTSPTVTYPGGSMRETAVVLFCREEADRIDFVVDRTPCHPENPKWPDQPADICTATIDSRQHPITCREGAIVAGRLADPAQPHGGDEVVPCVVHSVQPPVAIAPGDRVILEVNARFRQGLSLSHSRCHLGAFALNRALAQAWRKDPGRHDSLGNPDFDQLAIVSSKIHEHESIDTYRIGKSLRKKGFTLDAIEDLPSIERAIEDSLRSWLEPAAEILLDPHECALEDRRLWQSTIEGTPVEFPCGGTHPDHIGASSVSHVKLAWVADESTLTMRLS